MVAAEMTTEVFQVQGPVVDKKWCFFTGQAAVNSDFVTFTAAGSGVTTIEGFYAMATDGTIATGSWVGLKLTITNAAAKLWHGFIWGV